MGGVMAGGTISQAGADTFNTGVNWLMMGLQMQENAKASEQAFDLAQILRKDTLAQNAATNKIAQGGLNIQAGNLALSQQQFAFNKDMTQKALSTQEFEAMTKRLNDQMNINQQFRQNTRTLLGGK